MFLGSGDAVDDRTRIERALQAKPQGITFGQLRSEVQTVSEKNLRLHIVGLIARGSAIVTKTFKNQILKARVEMQGFRRNARYRRELENRDSRTPAQVDRDRVLYSSALARLAEITQVVPSNRGHAFHNRLTHSLKVAQLARRMAEKLKRARNSMIEAVGGISEDVAEAAALAHDLGHPPFGHSAEKKLNALAIQAGCPDGFELECAILSNCHQVGHLRRNQCAK